MTMDYRFRGYDVTGQKGWVYGDLTHSKRILQEAPFLADRVMVGGYEVYPESVGLFTGLKDINGKDIYEGDVVRRYESAFDVSSDSVVIYSPEDASFVLHQDDGIVDVPFSKFLIIEDGKCTITDIYTYEVIGNVFENSFKK